MATYVNEIEDLINIHPLSKRGLIDHPEKFKVKNDTGQGITCLLRLADVNHKIKTYLEKENKKL